MAINIDNAQFRAFTKFAAGADSGSTAVRMTDLIAGQNGKPRKIVANTADSVGNILRCEAKRNINNSVRDLFKSAILQMFGVADTAQLPESVQSAMKLSDYGRGKPLTARRIIAVSKAISRAIEKENATVGAEKARTFVDDSIRFLDGKLPGGRGAALDENKRGQAAALLVKHGKGLTDNCLRLVANYVTIALKCGFYDAQSVDGIAGRMANYFKSARNFRPGDVRMAKFDAKMTEYWQDTLKDKLAPGTGDKFDDDGVSQNLQIDASRASFTIAGEHFAQADGRGSAMIDKFKSVIANPAHRKAISSFMNQTVAIMPMMFSSRGNLYPTTNFPDFNATMVKGFENILSADVTKDINFFGGPSILGNSRDISYSIEVDDGGTQAKLSIKIGGDTLFNIADSDDFGHSPTGTYSIEMEFHFDLSDPAEAKLASTNLAQSFSVPVPQAPQNDGAQRIVA